MGNSYTKLTVTERKRGVWLDRAHYQEFWERKFWSFTPFATVSRTMCWEWQGNRESNGYGRFLWECEGKRKRPTAHRVAYELMVGAIPDGYVIDHLCSNRICVNPAHLQAVTQQTNVLRGQSVMVGLLGRSHCPKGHEYTDENTYVHVTTKTKNCRICSRARTQARNSRSKT